jgi:hypothetical protein
MKAARTGRARRPLGERQSREGGNGRPQRGGPAIPSPRPFDPPRTIAVELLADAAGVREG